MSGVGPVEAGGEGEDGEALVAAGERVCGVDFGVAVGAEGGRVRLAEEGGGGAFARLADPHALVSRGRRVEARVASRAEVRGVRPAVDGARGSPARVAHSRPRVTR